MSDPVVLLSTGDVVGPAGGVTDNSMVLFSGTSGKLIKGNNAVVTAAGLALLDDVNAAAQRTTLGLGTAATANVTTGTTDQTAGSVLKVGDFGLGTTAVPYGGDLNLLGNVTGFYRTISGVTNYPNGCTDSCFVHIGSGDTYSQTIVGYNNNRMYTRGGVGVVPNISWQPWREIALTTSPAFTGTPTAPTASAGTNTTQLATTAFVQASTPLNLKTSGISGSFSDLKASATGTNATVTVTAGSICLKNSSNEQVVVNSLALAINSAAVGANGLDTGVLAASTWYHVWVIWNGTTTAGLLSLSPTAPTMPVGYTHKARIGEIRTDATLKHPLSYYQYGDLIQINKAAGTNVPAMIIAATGSTGGVMAALGLSSFVPATAISARISAYSSGDSNCQIAVAPSVNYGIYEFSGGSGPSSAGFFAVSLLTEVPLIPGSMTVGIQSSTANAKFYVNGWRTQL